MGEVASLAQGVGSIYIAKNQANALRRQGELSNQSYEINSRFAELQARDAIGRGDESAAKRVKQGKTLIGSQRAALAAQGIDISSGSALEVQLDTARQTAEDSVQIKNNAWREAWGFKIQANDLRSRGSMALLSANNQASSTMLTGGLQAIGHGVNALNKYGSRTGNQNYVDNKVYAQKEANKQAARNYFK